MARGSVQKLNDTTIYSEKTDSPNFTADNKTFCLSLHYNRDNCYLFVNGKKFTQFKAKDSEIKTRPLDLGRISAFPSPMNSDDIKDSKLYGNVYDFSVDYSSITNDKIQDICKYFMKKNNIV